MTARVEQAEGPYEREIELHMTFDHRRRSVAQISPEWQSASDGNSNFQ